MKIKWGLLILLAAKTLSAAAGVGAHGGNVVICPGKEPVTLDYYNATLPTASGPVKTVDLSGMTEEQVFQLVRSRFDGSPFQFVFDRATNDMGPMSTWIATDLKSVDDSNEPYFLPAGCTRRTAAVRQGTSMYVDLAVTALLSPAQIGLLHAHEVLYKISDLDSSAPVRDLFRELLADPAVAELIARKMQPFGRFAVWDEVIRGTWRPDPANAVQLGGYFNWDTGTSAPDDGPLPLSYMEYSSNSGSYTSRIKYIFTCDLSAQSCTVVAQKDLVVSDSSPPNLVGCVLRMPAEDAMTLQCPQLGGTANFRRSPR